MERQGIMGVITSPQLPSNEHRSKKEEDGEEVEVLHHGMR
jgi:hypothetical protein